MDSKTEAINNQDLIDLIDQRIAQYHADSSTHPYSKPFIAVVDSVNDDATVNVHKLNSSVILRNFPNRSCTDVQKDDVVYMDCIDNSMNNCVVKYQLGNTPVRIGYKNCYITYDKGLQIKNDKGEIVGGLDKNGNFFCTEISTPDSPIIGIIGTTKEGYGGLQLIDQDNNNTFYEITELMSGGVDMTNKGRRFIYVDDNQSTLRWNNSDNSKGSQVECNEDSISLRCNESSLFEVDTSNVWIIFNNSNGTYGIKLGVNNNNNIIINNATTYTGTSGIGGMHFESGMFTGSDVSSTVNASIPINNGTNTLHFTGGLLVSIT